jgi:aryl-alcohol dehydrogenase-like predicted oxidoreductase
VAKANEYARCNGLRQFCVYQGRWPAATRDSEREIIPMCGSEGMGLAPWGALGGGMFKTEEQRKKQKEQKEGRSQVMEPREAQIKVSKALESVAKRKGSIITSIAQAYVSAKAPYVFTIVGGRNVEHLKGSIEALNIRLSDDDIKEIEDAVPFGLGFPSNFLYGEKLPDNPGAVWVLGMGGTLDHVPEPQPLSKE